MKVGTDGTLLGAWAHGGRCILDVGTGTGLIALMMAQRFPQASVTGIDIDGLAARQAAENVAASPFSGRVTIANVSLQQFSEAGAEAGRFDAIVANPPYYNHSLPSPDAQRTVARHALTLTYGGLMRAAKKLLSEDGELSVVVPFDSLSLMESEACLAGFFKSRQCDVRTTPRKQPRRYLLAFRKHPPEAVEHEEGVLEASPGQRSEWYAGLTREFYLY